MLTTVYETSLGVLSKQATVPHPFILTSLYPNPWVGMPWEVQAPQGPRRGLGNHGSPGTVS